MKLLENGTFSMNETARWFGMEHSPATIRVQIYKPGKDLTVALIAPKKATFYFFENDRIQKNLADDLQRRLYFNETFRQEII